MELNAQPVEHKLYDTGGILEVHSVWETIQGEGPFVGCPAVFVRLAGCNLQCPLCDTEYTKHRRKLYPSELMSEIMLARDCYQKSGEPTLVVITGGEPFRQNLLPLVLLLLEQGYRIQVETNGTICDNEFFNYHILEHHAGRYANHERWLKNVFVVCSPKAKVAGGLWHRLSAVKYVVHADDVDADGLPSSALGNSCKPGRPPEGFTIPIYVQPVDEQDEVQNKRHMKAALDSCFKFGYRLCIQTHKVVGLP